MIFYLLSRRLPCAKVLHEGVQSYKYLKPSHRSGGIRVAPEIDEQKLTLDEFVSLPTTVSFGAFNNERFRVYLKDKPYIRVGKILEGGFIIAYANMQYIQRIFEELGSSHFMFFPKILSPVYDKAFTDAGITQVTAHPFLGLSGSGVIIGIIDTGIDYKKDVFKYEDGTTKIIRIWDQTINGDRPDGIYYGSVFTREQINEAIRADNPYQIVPTVDTDGHGTFLASVAAGSKTNDYVGAAPGSNLVIVKLRRANQYYIDRYFRPPDEPNLYESSDYILGANYIFEVAKELNVPVVLCIGMGSNQGTQDGNSILEEYISSMTRLPGFAAVTAAGNESNAKHHTSGVIPRTGSTSVISIRVGVKSTSFATTILGASYDKISISITSPTGEAISRIPYRLNLQTTEEFTFDKTLVTIGYYKSVKSLIFITFKDAKEGIWEITLYGDSIVSGDYHAYLPITGQVDPAVEYMKPVPESTIVFPANAMRTITCGAYNSSNNSLYESSSWGPTLLPRMSPDFVAPGVNVQGVYPTGLGAMTGTSVAAAITAGAAAILMEWGIVQGNLVAMDGEMIKILLVSGCERDEGILYPNTRWGYGKLNLMGALLKITESAIQYNGLRGASRTIDFLHLQ